MVHHPYRVKVPGLVEINVVHHPYDYLLTYHVPFHINLVLVQIHFFPGQIYKDLMVP